MTAWQTALLLPGLLLLVSGCGTKRPAEERPPQSVKGPSLSSFVEEYVKAYHSFHPSEATAAGFHEYDTQLEDFSASRMRGRTAELRQQLVSLVDLRAQKLSSEDDVDAQILEGRIRAELLDIDTLRSWRRNAIPYVSAPGQAVDLLMKREFAPAAERLKSLTARLKGVERLLSAMRENVADPPKELTELAHRIASGSVGFFRDTVSAWARQAAGEDEGLFAAFQSVNQKTVASLEATAQFLKSEQMPLSNGSFAIGPDAFGKKLQYEEMIDLPLDKLLAIGEAQLAKDHKAFVETARRIQPEASAREVMRSLSNQHPTESQLLDFAKGTVESIRKFVVDKRIISIPSQTLPTILETPPYARSGAFASMDTPGAFERVSREAFYYITPPEQEWSRGHKEEHLRLFNKPVMDIITIHEAYPGHYAQFLYAKDFPTKTRKLFATSSNAEGWAHYAEQMMLEEGFGDGDPKIRLAQLSEALLRDCRFVAGIKMHTQNQTVEQAARLFVDKGFQEPANAYEEARRGAYDPTYLYYTAGKLQIYKLRDDYKRAHGGEYSLEKFHTEFIKQGAIPVKLLRKSLLKGDQSPAL